jgi:tryptophanyl-tRNA synthetase
MVMDLQDPTWKMSTSADSDAGVVRLLDPPEVVAKKVRSAVTDSGRDVARSPEKPGVTNLIEILAASTAETPESVEAAYGERGYGAFKSAVADAVVEVLRPIQQRYAELRADPQELGALLAQGAEKAHAEAARTLALAHERVGFVAP